MRIGEVAALVGVSTRTVRHYHRLGLLPEPQRRPNGYRAYSLRDAVQLARIRRLAELGLALDEIRDVLVGDEGRNLRDVLAELDADLAQQQTAIGERRDRLAVLLAQTELDPESTVSPDLAAVLSTLPSNGSRFAQLDRDLLSIMDTGVDPAHRAELLQLFRPMVEPAALARAQEFYARLDELAGAASDDARIEGLANDLAGHLPPELTAAMLANMRDDETGAWLHALAPELSAAQIQVLRRMVELVRERARC